MKKMYTSIIILLALNLTAQNWQTISTDPTGDGSNPSLLDGTKFSYWYNQSTDSLWFEVETANLNNSNSQAMGVNIMANVAGAGQTFNFWGAQNSAPYHFLLTAWVTGSAPSSYSGTIGVSNASGVNSMNYTSLSQNNLTIRVNVATKKIVIGLLRKDLIPDAQFSGSSVTVKVAAAVGSNQVWNDDVYSPNGEMTLAKQNNVSIDEDRLAKVTLYPNPAQNSISLKNNKLTQNYTIRDITGRVVQQGNVEQSEPVNIERLNSGVYFFQVGTQSIRFSKL